MTALLCLAVAGTVTEDGAPNSRITPNVRQGLELQMQRWARAGTLTAAQIFPPQEGDLEGPSGQGLKAQVKSREGLLFCQQASKCAGHPEKERAVSKAKERKVLWVAQGQCGGWAAPPPRPSLWLQDKVGATKVAFWFIAPK